MAVLESLYAFAEASEAAQLEEETKRVFDAIYSKLTTETRGTGGQPKPSVHRLTWPAASTARTAPQQPFLRVGENPRTPRMRAINSAWPNGLVT
jgi:hypothetical protein